MPNDFLTVDVIAREALATLYETTVMAGLVNRDYDHEFDGEVNGYRKGQTINVRNPAVLEANEFDRSDGIELQGVDEDTIPVVLDTIADVSVVVTTEELSLDISAFGERVVTPAMEAMRQKIDRRLLALRADIAHEVGQDSRHPWHNPRVLIDGRKDLNSRNVRMSQRYAVVGPEIEAAWLGNPLLHQADMSGSTEGLREAQVGRAFGFDTFMSQNVDDLDGEFDGETGLAFHRNALVLASRPLALPEGAASATTVGVNGFTMRVVRDYDIHRKEEIVSFDVLFGVRVLDPDKAVLIVGDDDEPGNGEGGTQDVNIVGTDTTVPVEVTGQPIETTSSNGGGD